MLEILAVLAAVALGVVVLYAFTHMAAVRPRWAAWLLLLGVGAAGGIGLTSVLFFVARLAFPAAPILAPVLEAAVWAACVWKLRRSREQPAASETSPAPFAGTVAAALLLAIVIITVALAGAWEANPQGNWDAWAIWNLRARFLAGDDGLPARAWSPLLGATHPEYPLLTSAFIARCWALARSQSAAAPIVTSYTFFLAVLAMAAGAFAARRSRTLGLILALIIASSPVYLLEIGAQYADVAISCYFAAAALFILLDRPVLAGVFAGMAAWTKDEGVLFAAVLLVAILLFQRRQVLRAAAGMAPVMLLVLIFKTVLVSGSSTLVGRSLPGAAAKLSDPARYGMIASAFARQFAGLGAGWYHPALAIIVLYLSLHFDRQRMKDTLFCCAVAGGLLVGYFGMYLITFSDLAWQLGTSANRLFAQVWPAMVIAAFAGLRTPEESAVVLTSKSKTRK